MEKTNENNLSGEDLFKSKGLKVLFKKSLITVIINSKEHIICNKNKITKGDKIASYSKEIKNAYYKAIENKLIK
jgi:hypothetical protein